MRWGKWQKMCEQLGKAFLMYYICRPCLRPRSSYPSVLSLQYEEGIQFVPVFWSGEVIFFPPKAWFLSVFQWKIEPVFSSFSTASTPEESRDGKKDKEGDRASEEGKQKGKGSKPLMPTSTILRLLAELVRSYVGIATLIANYSYTVGQSELIKEVMFSSSA